MNIEHPTSNITINLIAAMAENRVIGKAGQLPWRLPDEMKHFMRLTTGHTVVMGRKTFESIGCKPLPNRRNVILSRNPDYAPKGVEVVPTLVKAFELVKPGDHVFICGGEQAYRDALPLADRLYLTIVHAKVEGDTHFPELHATHWKLTDSVRHEADERHAYAFTFHCYERLSDRGREPSSPS